ncbi:hypothetical protein [Blastococcus haudaquaticus]|uniref:Uncharacterized protein n=1 Tax=Blastococcus haudaquaticus TaxID=1938745 RepID=A0A286GDJ7_9ACTN|nr:hypothetical protein [Blastococcus haudaquaticus]SOD93568.1 hypothetical protein SAMN06272739_0344 [Blastococcus haudaquaticus]
MTHTVRFAATPAEHTGWDVLPYLDDVPLTELVADYEQARDFDVVGGYGPLWFDAGSREVFRRTLLPRPADRPARRWLPGGSRRGHVSLLECECEVPGCWPFHARIDQIDGLVRWHSFAQPHRPDRDYSGLGPFEFELPAYRRAVDVLLDR